MDGHAVTRSKPTTLLTMRHKNTTLMPFRSRHGSGILIGLLLVALVLAAAACNLSTAQEARLMALEQTRTAQPDIEPPAAGVPEATGDPAGIPTQITLVFQSTPATVPPLIGAADECDLLRVYAGVDPGNTLRLRDAPALSGTLVMRIPNNAIVIAVPTLQEVQADGHHWRNVIYTAPDGTNYTGWAARDASTSFATLIPERACSG